MSVEFMIYGALFVGVFLVVISGYYLVASAAGQFGSRVDRRLEAMEVVAEESDVLALRLARRRAERQVGPFSGLARKAEFAGLSIGRWAIVGVWLALGLVLFLVIRASAPVPQTLAFLLGAAAAYAAIWTWLSVRLAKRRSQFEEQLPDALDLIVRSLRIGQPLTMAITSVSRDMAEPIGPEFAKISQELTYGMGMPEAFDRLAERHESPDLRFLSMAISIHSQSGGSLAELIESLANLVRSRFLMFRKIRSITSEARFSGWFLSIFPIFMVFAVQWVRPDYFSAALELPNFNMWAFIFVAMLLLNIIFMRVISNIKV